MGKKQKNGNSIELKNDLDSQLTSENIAGSEKEKKDIDPSQKMEGKFYNALDHDIRRNLLKILGSDGLSSFTHFKRELKVSTGTLYHHLDVLKELISQNDRRKYILTNLGKMAYNFLIKNYDSFESSKIREPKLITERFKRLLMFVPVKTFEKIKQDPKFGWILSGSLLIVFYFLIFFGNIDSSFIFFMPYGEGHSEIIIGERVFLGFKFVIAVILCAISSDLLCRFLFGKNENSSSFFSVYAIGLSPMTIYLLIYNILNLMSTDLAESVLSKIIMIFFQIWAIWLISYIITIFKSIKLERSLLITFLIHYITFNILLFT